jgi:hypothetical protein
MQVQKGSLWLLGKLGGNPACLSEGKMFLSVMTSRIFAQGNCSGRPSGHLWSDTGIERGDVEQGKREGPLRAKRILLRPSALHYKVGLSCKAGWAGHPERRGDTWVTGGAGLAGALLSAADAAQPPAQPPSVHAWLAGEYAPLPSLVQAARAIFRRQPLPRVRRAHSTGVVASVEYLVRRVVG